MALLILLLSAATSSVPNSYAQKCTFKINVKLDGVDATIGPVKVWIRDETKSNFIQRTLNPASQGDGGLVDIGVFTFSSSEIPVGSSFTACADDDGLSSKMCERNEYSS